MPGTFEERLRDGPPIVADGGMGVILAAAVDGLRAPEEANLRAPEAVVSTTSRPTSPLSSASMRARSRSVAS